MAFTPKELREMTNLLQNKLEMDELFFKNCISTHSKIIEKNRPLRRLMDIISKAISLQERKAIDDNSCPIWSLKFCLKPIEILAHPEYKDCVGAVKFEKTVITGTDPFNPKMHGSGQFFILPADLVIKSIGYERSPIQGIPFDEKLQLLPNLDGRMKTSNQVINSNQNIFNYFLLKMFSLIRQDIK